MSSIPESFFGWVALIFNEYGGMFLRGTGATLFIAALGTIFGCLIGFVVGIIQGTPIEKGTHFGKKFLIKCSQIFVSIYVEIFRGTPMMVQAMVIYYGSMQVLGWNMVPIYAGVLILSLNTGAYMSESVRGGIVSIDLGQTEGAKAIGMTHFQTMIYVILPQAFRNLIPQIGNGFVSAIKDTSVLNVISVTELYFMGRTACGTYFRYFEVFFIISLIYLMLTFVTSRLLRILERKLDGDNNYDLIHDADLGEI
ncbi:amino acid ABC transporter permease [Fusibacter ferrireducens]|uniref:Amino acid ABC transporter permease n=1 Tax=Fusibacter ferrireducens TaxID=2785058 RepID=A0ABR9ZXI1_9FIRM|nr:amino acid ABC transporter permease [Fusibacter ferrireducens]MBF4695171.1 amino acid ABC transporter permease [Fusibacter ferrireducens]